MAARRHQQQRHGHRMHQAAGTHGVEVKLAQHQGLRIQVDVEGKNATQPQTERLGRPAGGVGLVAEHLLDQQQAQDGPRHLHHRRQAGGLRRIPRLQTGSDVGRQTQQKQGDQHPA